MRILKTAVAAATALALLAPAGLAFAHEENKGKGPGLNAGPKMASTTMRQQAKERMEAKREDIKQRLSVLQDKKKQEMAVRLSGQFDTLNEQWTDRFTKELDQMDKILGKIEARAASSSKDTSATTAAVDAAHTAIDAARDAVEAQAAKSYIIATSTLNVSASSTPSGQERIIQALRTSFKTLHQSLFTDLKALRDGPMKNARKAVQNAAVTLGKTAGEDKEKHATSTESEAD